MRISLSVKVFATLLLTTGLVVVGAHLFMRWSFEHRFVDFIETRKARQIEMLTGKLQREYAETRSLKNLQENPHLWRDMVFGERRRPGPKPDISGANSFRPPLSVARDGQGPDGFNGDFPPGRRPPPPGPPMGPGFPPAPPHLMPLYLLDAGQQVLAGPPGPTPSLDVYPVEVEGETVAYIGSPPGPPVRELAERQFESGFTRSMLIVSIGMLAMSALLSIPLAHALVKPLRRLAGAARQLALGRFETRLPAVSSDEIGALERDINELAGALEKAEHSRRQWIADISHELRTPIAILRGEVEALQDGVRPLNEQALDSFRGEILHLGRLVEDLYQLSQADAGALSYRKADVEPVEILDEVLSQFEGMFRERNIELVRRYLDNDVVVFGDADRLLQLFRNLVSNALKYTHEGGRVEVRSQRCGTDLRIDLMDSEPSVPDLSLPHLFDRFYRVEGSRNRVTGGAGLGLSLCRAIIEAHDGTIEARNSPLGGLWIQMKLPVDT